MGTEVQEVNCPFVLVLEVKEWPNKAPTGESRVEATVPASPSSVITAAQSYPLGFASQQFLSLSFSLSLADIFCGGHGAMKRKFSPTGLPKQNFPSDGDDDEDDDDEDAGDDVTAVTLPLSLFLSLCLSLSAQLRDVHRTRDGEYTHLN